MRIRETAFVPVFIMISILSAAPVLAAGEETARVTAAAAGELERALDRHARPAQKG